MMIHTITPCVDYNKQLKHLNTHLNEQTNQNLMSLKSCNIQTKKHTNRKIKQKIKQTKRPTIREINRQTDTETDKWAENKKVRQTNKQTNWLFIIK